MPEQVISRVLFSVMVTLYGTTIIHLRVMLAQYLLRPTRRLGRATLRCLPIRSCSRWGLPSFPGHPGNWCALTTPFHPYPLRWRKRAPQKAVCFLWHFPSRHRDSALRSTLPCGARTFLPCRGISSNTSDRLSYSDIPCYSVFSSTCCQ